MQYPLSEKIGNPELLVGRKKEFTEFNKWLLRTPEKSEANTKPHII